MERTAFSMQFICYEAEDVDIDCLDSNIRQIEPCTKMQAGETYGWRRAAGASSEVEACLWRLKLRGGGVSGSGSGSLGLVWDWEDGR